jgi:short chain dehydrogenase
MGWIPADIPDLTGRRAIVTGANAGLGLEVAHGLAAHGAEVVLACRNTRKAANAAAAIRGRTPAAKVEVGPPVRAARPAPQQRRSHGDRRGPHPRGRRDAVRGEPPRALRAHRPAAAAAARHAGLAGREHVEHGAPRGPWTRRPAWGAALRPLAGVLPQQARQPPVHRRAAAAAGRGGGADHRGGRPSGRVEHRPGHGGLGLLQPGAAAGAVHRPARRARCPSDAAGAHRPGRAGRRVLRATLPGVRRHAGARDAQPRARDAAAARKLWDLSVELCGLEPAFV